jgi:hypothetical protein
VLRHLNYRPWFALGEFVDNAVESFSKHRSVLENAAGERVKLRVDIDIDAANPPRISIRDNAAGISESEYARAFRPAAIPPDRSGLAEFGMGMKSAACWFAPTWIVRTKAIGETVSRAIEFDIDNIVNDDIEELSIHERAEKPDAHYTEVVLENVFHAPVGRTVSKLKEHLTDIYRAFIRDGLLELRFNGEQLVYREPRILKAPYFKERNGADRLWRKQIHFDFGDGLSVHGFAAIRETANTAKAGFSLFRRGRVIQGSGDEGYRPPFIFGSSNSFRFQRIFGELHLEGFEVSHTKDGFRWDENEQPFLELLREHLDSPELPLLKQAEGHRARVPRAVLAVTARQAVATTAQALQNRLPAVLPALVAAAAVETPEDTAPAQTQLAARRLDIRFRGKGWSINVQLSDDSAESQWLVVSDTGETRHDPRRMEIRANMSHPFMIRFAQGDPQSVEALLRVAVAIAVGEVLARDAGVRNAGTVRRNINDLLLDALSEP